MNFPASVINASCGMSLRTVQKILNKAVFSSTTWKSFKTFSVGLIRLTMGTVLTGVLTGVLIGVLIGFLGRRIMFAVCWFMDFSAIITNPKRHRSLRAV